MSDRERLQAQPLPPGHFRVLPKRFVFFDKSTGTERFKVKAAPDGSLPVDQAASLMAIHCLVRARSPRGFDIMIAPEQDLLDDLLPMAKRFASACAENKSPA